MEFFRLDLIEVVLHRLMLVMYWTSLGRGQFSNREQFLAFQTDVQQRGRRLIVLDGIVGEDRGGS